MRSEPWRCAFLICGRGYDGRKGFDSMLCELLRGLHGCCVQS